MNETKQAADTLARASVYLWSTEADRYRGGDASLHRISRWQAAHALLMLSIGLTNHPRSFKGIRFDARGIAEAI